MLALVLGGGGAKGSYQIGVWKALIDMDIAKDIKIITGTSIGSLNGAFVAQGDYKKAIDMWNNFDAGKMLNVQNYDKLQLEEKTYSSIQSLAKEFLKEGGLEPLEYKKAILKYIDEDKVRKSKIKYGAVTVDITNQKPVEKKLEDMKKGQLVDYIMASSAIAPAIKPYEIDGAKHIDGGFYDVLPINMAVSMRATDIIAVSLNAIGVEKETANMDSIISLKYIKPYWDLGSLFVFDEEVVEKNIALGYLDTMKTYDAFAGNAYTLIKNNSERGLTGFRKNSFYAIKTGISTDKNNFSITNSIIKSNWEHILSERNKKGVKITSEILSCVEIVAEILKISPTKIYTIQSLNEKIKEKLKKVESIPLRESNKDIIDNLKSDLMAITDEQKRLKYFALEIENDLKKKQDIWIKKLAPFFTKEFFAGLYIATHKLL